MSYAITVLPAVEGQRWVCVEGRVDVLSAGDVRALLSVAIHDLPTRSLTVDLRRAEVTDDAGRRSLTEAAALAATAGVTWRVLERADTASLALAAG
ncbi:hypothetical protein AB0J80_20315 [Actinoplanes sp. NPDC049548]|uniref:hypothetical protein n=1 Tax=Actinoplanes sp. NPDC049548 TaxID=3155152 RepID=UPI003424ECD4